jgi:hypothetical protein
VRTIRGGQVGADSLGPAARVLDLGEDGRRLFFSATVLDEHLGAGLGEGQGSRAADAARCAGNKRGLAEWSESSIFSIMCS